MSKELFWLTLTVAMTGLIWVPYILDRIMVRGLMTTLGGISHTMPYIIPNFPVATTVAIAVVVVELALVPGVSRSGITICAGLLRNLDRATAARFSFLLATPAIAGAAGKDAWDLMRHGGGIASIPHDMRTAMLVGVVVSAITGALTIQFFLNFLKKRSLSFFVWYRVIFGIIVIALATFFRYHGG